MIAQATRERVIAHYDLTHDEPGKIALALNLSLATVSRVLREGGKSTGHKGSEDFRRMRDEQAPPVRQLAAEGVSPTQICKRLRLGYTTLLQIAQENGIELRQGKTGAPTQYDKKIDQIREMAGNGLSQSEISFRMSVPLPTLHRWLRQADITVQRDPGRTASPDQAAHFGATAEEHSETSRAGGLAAIGDKEITCLYCGKPFARGRTGSDRSSRDRYCTREHAYAHRRENSGKSIIVTCGCGCGEEFLTWASRPAKYLSREHRNRANKGTPNYGYEGHVLDSGYEAAFVGLCSLRGIKFEFFDRAEIVSFEAFGGTHYYGPDFMIRNGETLYVDPKGMPSRDRELSELKWKAFRAQRGKLAILWQEDLNRLFAMPTSSTVIAAIHSIAEERLEKAITDAGLTDAGLTDADLSYLNLDQ